VIVSGSFPEIVCGISPYVRRIAEVTAQLGQYDIHVLTSDDPAVDQDIAKGYQVHLRIKKWGYAQARNICREILALAPDAVNIQNPTIKYNRWNSAVMSVVGPLLKHIAPQLRLVVTQHDIAVGKPIFRWRYRPLFRAADAVIVSNSRDYSAVRAQGIREDKIYRAPMSSYFQLPARDSDAKIKARQKMGIPQDASCVTYFGFVLPGRNIDVLIGALDMLRRGGRDVYGLILGGPHNDAPDYYRHCQKLAEELGLGEHIIWTGFASDDQIADGMMAADVFVSLPERGADMRNTSIMTAIQGQLPVVTSRNERYYIDEDLENLGCRCVGPRDVKGVAEAVENLLDDPPSEKLLAQRAAALDPQAVWDNHIKTIVRACQ
jgi:glycosyltransferase involved in cell wall biosynthesis